MKRPVFINPAFDALAPGRDQAEEPQGVPCLTARQRDGWQASAHSA